MSARLPPPPGGGGGRALRGLVFAVMLLIAARSDAETPLPLPANPHYAIQHVGEAHGLGTKTPFWIRRDTDGFLWVGTHGGLYRFDGVDFQVFPVPSEGVSASLADAAESPDGKLWLPAESGLLRFDGQRFRMVISGTGFGRRTRQTEALAFDHASSPLLNLSDGLLRLSASGTSERLMWLDDRQPVHANAFFRLPDKRVLLVSGTDAGWVTTSGVERVRADGLPSDDPARSLLVDADGVVWVRSGRGLYRSNERILGSGPAPERFTFQREGVALPWANDFGGPRLDGSGNLMIPTVNGLFLREDGAFRRITREHGLASETVVSVMEDEDRALWIGYGGAGLDRWPSRRAWSAWSTGAGLPNEVVWSILRDRKNRLWVGTNGGLAVWDPAVNTWRVLTEAQGLPGRMVRRLVQAPDDSVWAQAVPGGFCRVDPDRLTAGPIPALPDQESPVSFCAGPDGEVLLASTSRLFSHGLAGYKELSRPTEFEGPIVASWSTGGGLWLSSRQGLGRWNGSSWDVLTDREGLLSKATGALLAVSKDEAWVGYRRAPGLSRVQFVEGHPRLRHYSRRDGLPGEHFFFLGRDGKGDVWAGGDSGVARIGLDGKVRAFTRADGLIWDDCSEDGFFADSDGSVWIGTSRGLSRYDPAADDQKPHPPRVVLTDVRLGSRSRLGEDAVSVPWNERSFSVRFTSPGFQQPALTAFRYRLVPLDSPSTETFQREARFPALPAGDYRFEVFARSRDGVWSTAPAVFSFSVLPPWWQTIGFRLALVLVLAGAVVLAVRLRTRRLVRVQKDLEGLVTARTQQLRNKNEELEGALTRLADAQRRILRLQEQTSGGGLDDLGNWSRKILSEISGAAGLPHIGVVVLENGSPVKLTEVSLAANPYLERVGELTGPEEIHSAGTVLSLLPLMGGAGRSLGALVVPAPASALNELVRQLLDSFARQLSASLDLRSMRQRVLDAQRQRLKSVEELRARGIEPLLECPRCHKCYPQGLDSCPDDSVPLSSARMFPYRIQQRYRMLRLLGEGGMGAVFEAEDEKLRRPVAVKIIASERINEGDTRARFEREARIVARLQSPAVISLYDSGELFDGSAFLIMELLKGLDLAKLVDRDGPGSPSQVARVLEQVSEGLSAAHALGVIHRDLKPGNIFLTPTAGGDFHVKLLDFGLAKHTVDDVSATRAGFIVGSPGYMSPEQLKEEPLDQRSDLFSLATLAYELLTGAAAFQGNGVAEIFTAILQSEPPPLEDYLPDAPRELQHAFEFAFAKSRTDRPDSVAVWVATLLPVLRQMPASSAGWKVEQLGG